MDFTLNRVRVAGAPDAAEAFLLACSLAMIGALSIPGIYHGLAFLLGKEVGEGDPQLPGVWQTLAVLVLWLASCWLAQAAIADSTWKWSAPVFLLVGIGAPVYVWVRLSAGGIRGGSERRRWGLLASGMWLSTGLALLAEAALGLLAIIALGVYFALNPSQVPLLQNFASRLSSASGPSDVLTCRATVAGSACRSLLGAGHLRRGCPDH